MSRLRTLFPSIEPYERGRLAVGDGHEIYYELSGEPRGKPVVVCHGGPGGGTTPSMRRYFDPRRYQIILFDQRGCGRSTPHAALENNSTWDLVSDMEKLRQHLGLQRWQVFGGSWGATLALAYAQTHPAQVSALVLRGVFLMRQAELDWFYKEGASWIFPDHWADFTGAIPGGEQDDLLTAYYRRLTSDDPETQLHAARAWSAWEANVVSLLPSQERVDSVLAPSFARAFARIECHYFINRGFFDADDQLLANVSRIRHIPATIVQGRYDVVTPVKSAYDLACRWPEAKFAIIPDAGHAASEPGIIDALVNATDAFARI